MLRKIASFTINHDLLTPGMYVSRIDGEDITYDLRVKFPNQGDYLEQKAMHTLEHLVATFVRSGDMSDQVVYFGPMGCRTGFYLILRDSVSKEDAIRLVQEAFAFAAVFCCFTKSTNRACFCPTTKCKFFNNTRCPNKNYEQEVWKQECHTTICGYHDRETPDVAHTNSRADTCQDKAPFRLETISFFDIAHCENTSS